MEETPASGSTAPSDSSLASFGELLAACLDAIDAVSVVEIGAYEGEFTRLLLSWARGSGGKVTAIEPDPGPRLLELRDDQPELVLLDQTSHEALRELPPADAVFIDGDHNHFTVLGELRLIDRAAASNGLPLVVLHDVCWPHARRDTYYAPERIPEEHRQPLAHDALIAPGVSGLASAGLRYGWVACEEGGPRNGVLTAVEDFLAGRDELRFGLVPIYFGLGLIWPREVVWAGRVRELVEPWDRNPILERLEAERVANLVDRHRSDQQRAFMRSLLDSRAFALAERVSRIRQGGAPVFSREQVRRLLDAGEESA
jgi:predicted O-methyltransferase YrrM